MDAAGKKVVLTAPDTDFTDFYNNPIWPFFFFSVSRYAFGGLINWVVKGGKQEVLSDGRARLAPYGLRKVEAALLENGFDENDIATVPPKSLSKFVGNKTKVIGITAMNTNGLTYCDQTFTALVGFGSDSYNSYKFRSLMFDKTMRNTKAKKILGGAGAWQVQGAYCRKYFNIDTIVMGEGENVVAPLFQQAIEGKPLPPIVTGTPIRDADKIPCIRNGTIYGTVEISRGCGRNCQFCTPTKRLRRDIPLSTIEQEIRINFRTRKNKPTSDPNARIMTPVGSKTKADLDRQQERMIFLATEDIMLYQCHSPDFMPNTEAILKLVKLFVDLGVESFQPSHISLAAVAASPDTLVKMTELLSYQDKSGRKQVRGIVHYPTTQKYIGVETGLETGSPRIIEKYMRGKCLPFKPEQWPEIVVQAMGILNDNLWFPWASLMTGMPYETDKDAIATLELLDDLKFAKTFYAPMFFTALGDSVLHKKRSANLKSLTDLQKEIFIRCWEHNVNLYRYGWNRPPQKYLIPFSAGFFYNLYYRWRRDRKFFGRFINKISMMPLRTEPTETVRARLTKKRQGITVSAK